VEFGTPLSESASRVNPTSGIRMSVSLVKVTYSDKRLPKIVIRILLQKSYYRVYRTGRPRIDNTLKIFPEAGF
jgi:hypothetical protein